MSERCIARQVSILELLGGVEKKNLYLELVVASRQISF
jgi:hypothetical protein